MAGEAQGFNPLEEARENGDEHRRRYYEMVGDSPSFPDHGTFGKAHQEFAAYLETRNTQDAKGNIHRPDTKFTSLNSDEARRYEASLAETDQFAGKSLDDLARMVADARARGDRTGAGDAEDAFFGKFAAAVDSGELHGMDTPEGDAIDRRLDHFSEIMYGSEQNSTPEAGKANEQNVSTGENTPVNADSNKPEANVDQNGAVRIEVRQGDSTPEATADVAVEAQPNAPTPDKPEKKKGFDPDVAAEEALARIQEKADALVPAVEATLEAKYPKIEPIDLGEDEPKAPTGEAKGGKTDKIEPIPLPGDDEKTGKKGEKELPTLDEAKAKLRETDKFKAASAKDQELMLDNLANRYIDAAAKQAEKKDGRTDSEKQLDAYLEANKGLMEGLSDKEKARLRKILLTSIENGLIDKEKLPKAKGEKGEDGTGEDDPVKKAEAEKLAHIEAEMKRITETLENGELGKKYKEALSAYAEAKADYDTKLLAFGGQRRREEALNTAEKALTEAKLAYAKELVKNKSEAGLYEGAPNIVGAAMSNDLFDEIRKIDPESRASTEAVRGSRIEKRNFLQKGMAVVGRFLNRGNKIGRAAKNVASGAVTGFVTGLGLATAGATWPVTAGVAAGASLLVRAASTSVYLDESLRSGAYKKALVEDTHFRNFVERANRTVENGKVKPDDALAALAGDILGSARQMGLEQNKQARRRASARAGEFAVGFALGGVGGHMLHDALSQAPAPEITQSSDDGLPPKEDRLPTKEIPGKKEVIKGLTTSIHHGEGGGEFTQDFLRSNGIKLSGSESIQAWDKATHGANALDIFTQNGGKPDTYGMTGKFGGHAGLAYPGQVTLDHSFAQRLLEAGKALAGK